jgi:hypothetical protein
MSRGLFSHRERYILLPFKKIHSFIYKFGLRFNYQKVKFFLKMAAGEAMRTLCFCFLVFLFYNV